MKSKQPVPLSILFITRQGSESLKLPSVHPILKIKSPKIARKRDRSKDQPVPVEPPSVTEMRRQGLVVAHEKLEVGLFKLSPFRLRLVGGQTAEICRFQSFRRFS